MRNAVIPAVALIMLAGGCARKKEYGNVRTLNELKASILNGMGKSDLRFFVTVCSPNQVPGVNEWNREMYDLFGTRDIAHEILSNSPGMDQVQIVELCASLNLDLLKKIENLEASGLKPGSLLLSRDSDQAGTVNFNHYFHSNLTSAEGKPISCVRCHIHDGRQGIEKLPWRCLDCHPAEVTEPRYMKIRTRT